MIVGTIERYGVYQDVETRWYVPRSPPYKELRGTIGTGEWRAKISNTAVLRETQRSVQTLGSSVAIYITVTGEKVGTALVTFEGRGKGVTSARAIVPVEVTECGYEVHTFSIWHVNAGRNIAASASIDTVIERQGSSLRQISLVDFGAKAENYAISFPAGGCPVVETISESPAPVVGWLDMDDAYELSITIRYGPVTAGTEVNCGGQVGTALDPGKPEEITFVMGAGGGDFFDPHVLHVPGIGDFTGMTYITVRPIPK